MSEDPKKLGGWAARQVVPWHAALPKKVADLPVVLCFVGIGWLLTGCDDQVRRLSTEEWAAFEAAESMGPSIDMERILQAGIAPGPYRTVPGDILQVEMPRILDPQSLDGAMPSGNTQTYACRIDDEGSIILPVIGPLAVAGNSLVEIESAILAAYYPKYIRMLFPVHVTIQEHNTQYVSITGAVARPGIYGLRHDQMSLVALLMEAGGIVERGAAVIRIARRDGSEPLTSLPVARHSMAPHDAGVQEIAQQTWTDEPQAAHSVGRAGRTGGTGTIRAVFEREGPVNTAGWLTIEDEGTALIRRWLDVGSEAQRLMFLKDVAGASQQVAIADLHGKLARLAQALEPIPPGHAVQLKAGNSAWSVVDELRLETSLTGPTLTSPRAANQAAGARTAEVVGESTVTTLALPVRGLNIPFADAALQEGDSVVVEWPHEQFISVVGLVNSPGNFPYPPNARYTLIQAIASAGGLDLIADPRYVSVYRLQPNGEVARATFHLVDPEQQGELTEALAVPLRPGDVVSIEHTVRTRTNVFFDRIFRISLGLYFNPVDVWDND